ncbi:hypothetical protein Bpfe_011490 [Biomphalaria pfeifferi]|uniref:Uncharacterized protein n=1 Tax=Biomphalaria pfeifferi TaxID=112525 RepID=A0AAD8FDG3_BIOPF|nr:hypothetical protein Bpfe_011490 [Biomphalaria pfeifferi]
MSYIYYNNFFFKDHNLERSLAKLCAIISDTSSWLSLNNEAKSCQVVLTAPTRMHSFCQVLKRFHFRTVGYLGPENPEKDHLNSKIYYENENVSIQVNFSQQKDCIVLSDVIFSKSVKK